MDSKLLKLIYRLHIDLNKYKYYGYYNIEYQYFKHDFFTYNDSVYLVLKPVMAITPSDDRVNYVKVPETEEEYIELLNYYGCDFNEII